MTPELIAMLGGGVSGFVMKLIGAQMDTKLVHLTVCCKSKGWWMTARIVRLLVGGYGVRRGLVAITFFAIIVAPLSSLLRT